MTGRFITLSLIATVVLLMPTLADAQHVHRGGAHVAVGASIVVGSPYYGYGSYWYGPWYPYGYWYPAPYYYGPGPYYYDGSASLKIEVTPRQTEVFVDGYYAGLVDSFDGTFQRLSVEPGEHELQLFLPGHRLVSQRVYLQPRQTFKVRYTMEALGAGEQEPQRPANAPATARPQGAAPAPGPGIRAEGAAPRGNGNSDYGALAIRVQPGDADILVDGEHWEGSAGDERLVVQLAPGPHRIEVRKSGYRGYMTEITVQPGQTESVNVALAK